MPKLKINVPDIDGRALMTIAATYGHDWETGFTTYTVAATRVSGTFTLAPNLLRSGVDGIDADTQSVYIGYGHGHPWMRSQDDLREDRPIVNGIKLVGGAVANLDTMRTRRLTHWDISARRSLGPYQSCSVPQATNQRTATVVHALVAHWATRPENYALRLTAARWRAGSAWADFRRTAEQLNERLADLQREIAANAANIAKAETLIGMPFTTPTLYAQAK
jgi:hypothetical protein